MGAHAFFTITGDFLTQTARDLMLSEEPGRAWRLLADSLIGDGADAVIRKVLAGEVNLTGDSRVGVGVEDADPEAEDVRRYLDDLRYIYAGRVRLQGRWYRPRGVVVQYGPEDARAAGPAPGRSGLAAWGRRRAEFYACDGERVESVERIDGERIGHYVVFEACGEPPQWLTPARDAQAAVDEALAAGRSLERLGAFGDTDRPSAIVSRMVADGEIDSSEAAELRELAEAAEDEMFAAELVRIATAVREQAGADVFAMTLADGRIAQVPRAPFVHWALHRLPGIRHASLPEWKPVSPSGIKMINDDPHHTDWVLGAGLTIEDGYSDNVTGPAWEAAFKIQIAEVDRADA